MRYYTITPTRDLDEIGEYPQTRIHKNINHDFYRVSPYSFPDFEPQGALDLVNNAKPTDLIEGVGISFGYIVNSSFKKLLESCKLPPFKFYPTQVFYLSKKLNYFWFHYLSSIQEYVNIYESKITLFDKFNFDIIDDDVSVSSPQLQP